HIFDVLSGEFFATAVDDVLDASGHGYPAIGIDRADIAGTEPSVLADEFRVALGIGVAEHPFRCAYTELAPLPRRQDRARLVDRMHFCSLGHAPIPRGTQLERRIRTNETDRGHLGQSPASKRPNAHGVRTHNQRWRNRCAATHERL